MDWLTLQDLLPILGALVAGGAIGFEREYRARPAGLRTHVLVSLASALLMLAAVHQVRWMSDTPTEVLRIDPVRMAHGVLTGVGFLCGGVIFQLCARMPSRTSHVRLSCSRTSAIRTPCAAWCQPPGT